MKSKLISTILAAAMTMTAVAFPAPIQMDAQADSLIVKKFDLGGLGAADGYIGVFASDGYNSSKGYGFANTDAVENVTASGTGALADAVRFKSDVPNHIFNIDLPSGVYKITVTTGDVQSTIINAEGVSQLFFLTGSNATDSFTIPVTDGQLNIYAGSGVGTEFSLSTIEIEQTSTGTTTKPTIWVGGDSTAASYYNVSDDAVHGWGQYLSEYVDGSKYDVRNISASGITSSDLNKALFGTIEHYGKKGDILLLSVGINDYTKAYSANSAAPDPSSYIANMTDMVQRAKAKGMTVYLVKQHGELNDCAKYPLIQNRWFSDSIDEIADAEQVEILDLFHPWLTFCLENTYTIAKEYYTADGLHLNLSGADKMAQMIHEQLFPPKESGEIVEDPYKDFDTASTVYYQTEVSGGPVPNPHKGYVMTVYNPDMFESTFPYGIGGSMNNHAWDVVTICNGVHYWEDINPQEGVYNWKEIDDMLDACEKYGMTYVIRILPYSHLSGSHENYGEAHDFVPQWVYDKGAKKKRVTLLEDPSVALDVPVWDDEIYLQACKDFAAALGEHFDGDPRVEFVDIRPFGNWGEWHFSQVTGSEMPSVEIQKDMLKHYKDAFDQTLLAVPSNAWGEVYEYALSIGVAKRDDGLIASSNREWGLRLSYKANMPALAENAATYSMMLENENGPYGPLKWTPQRFRECIEIAHLTATALDQDSQCGYKIYTEQKELVDEMVNRMGYNFTVTSAKRNDNQLLVTIKNTGLAPAFFNIDLCAEITDKDGNKLESFGEPVRIEEGSFHDEEEKAFLFAYDGTLPDDAIICLAMYDSDNPLVKGKNPTIRFDNKNTLSTNRLQLVTETPNGVVNSDGKFDVLDVVLLQKWLLAVPDVKLANWRAGDFCNDGRLDVFDLCLMKCELLKNN